MSVIARVRIPSPLPALDKEFDYLVPPEMGSVTFGQLVRVPFGKDKSAKTAVVVGVESESTFNGQLSEIEAIETQFPLLTIEQLELAQSVSERFLGSVSELLSSILPKRMLRVEKNWSPNQGSSTEQSKQSSGKRIYLQPAATRVGELPNWAITFAQMSLEYAKKNLSVLVALPDFRDLQNFEKAMSLIGQRDLLQVIHSGNTESENYLTYLKATSSPGVYVGLRSAIFLPSANLGALLVLDDGDDSHTDPSSPYWNTRDVALIRQSLEGCDLVFTSLSPSSEVVRLVELGYLKHISEASERPAVKVTASKDRLEEGTYSAIASALKANHPVLVQIANLGYATAVACVKCSNQRVCNCSARIWIDPQRKFRCRSCKASGELPPCSCGERRIRIVRTGSSAMVEWLKKSFPEANVIHSSAEERITEIEVGPNLVISTPGSEPEVAGGYRYVVLADAFSMVGAPKLRALERSLLFWANAAEKVAKDGVVVFVGLTDRLATLMGQMDFYTAMKEDFLERTELGLPPTRRIASVSSNSATDLELLKQGLSDALADFITPIVTPESDRIAFCFNYSNAATVSSSLRSLLTSISSKSRAKLPGQRLFHVRMDDANAI